MTDRSSVSDTNEQRLREDFVVHELRHLLRSALEKLTPLQRAQLKTGNTGMIAQFPNMHTAWALQEALQVYEAHTETKPTNILSV